MYVTILGLRFVMNSNKELKWLIFPTNLKHTILRTSEMLEVNRDRVLEVKVYLMNKKMKT